MCLCFTCFIFLNHEKVNYLWSTYLLLIVNGKIKAPVHTGLTSCSFRLHGKLSVLPGYGKQKQILYPLYLLMVLLLPFPWHIGRQIDVLLFSFFGRGCVWLNKNLVGSNDAHCLQHVLIQPNTKLRIVTILLCFVNVLV